MYKGKAPLNCYIHQMVVTGSKLLQHTCIDWNAFFWHCKKSGLPIIRDPWFTDVLQSFSLLFISPQTSMSAWIPPKTHALIAASTRTTASLVAVHRAPPWLQMASAVEVHIPIVSTFYTLFNSYLCTPNALNWNNKIAGVDHTSFVFLPLDQVYIACSL